MAQIPEPAKERLLYLMRLLEKRGGQRITSGEVESLTGWSSHTIRKDISYLGATSETSAVLPAPVLAGLGSSAGYDPETLIPAIRRALGLGGRRRICVVGLGRLGSAYLNFRGFDFAQNGQDEFELIAGFDSNVNRVEILKSPVPLYPAFKMAEVITRFGIELALLCVPEDAAQTVAEKLTAAGIRGIINFAPIVLNLPPEFAVRNVYIIDELRALAVKVGPAHGSFNG